MLFAYQKKTLFASSGWFYFTVNLVTLGTACFYKKNYEMKNLEKNHAAWN